MIEHNESDLRQINELSKFNVKLMAKLKAGRMKCLDIIDDTKHAGSPDALDRGAAWAAEEILRALENGVSHE